jgi:hypothetical protein
MPSVTITKVIVPQDAAEALKATLGSEYKVTPHLGRIPPSLTVSRAGVAFATVRVLRGHDATTFRVHGGGLIIGRLVNEFGIARTVADAIKASLGD